MRFRDQQTINNEQCNRQCQRKPQHNNLSYYYSIADFKLFETMTGMEWLWPELMLLIFMNEIFNMKNV